MSDAVAFALTAEYEGTTTVQLEDGATEERPIFAGGLLHTDPGDFDVAAELEAGKGTIVASARDQRLVDLLDAYPPLKRVAVPDGAKPISPYARLDVETLRHTASLRDVDGAGSASRTKIIRALDAQDRALAAGAQASAAAASVTVDPVDELSVEDLAAVLDNDTTKYPDAGRVEIPAAVEELRRRAGDGVKSAKAALETRNLTQKEA